MSRLSSTLTTIEKTNYYIRGSSVEVTCWGILNKTTKVNKMILLNRFRLHNSHPQPTRWRLHYWCDFNMTADLTVSVVFHVLCCDYDAVQTGLKKNTFIDMCRVSFDILQCEHLPYSHTNHFGVTSTVRRIRKHCLSAQITTWKSLRVALSVKS